LDPLVASSMDEGVPMLLKAPDSEVSSKLRELAEQLDEALSTA
ncbi:MAG: ATP-binding protein, partial [Thermoprotei archaeon]